ncbi:hypothetical protein PAV_4c02410 [Paenibacillus alvei DSM 29]|uniref:hypothetical protein n=1 Tax=Paenibacillus alvei TaxID=44250 RepID=UPI000287EF19|nr:hypothetical protein PAV_4c02410 [Paenibacillus alvei DSM 29]
MTEQKNRNHHAHAEELADLLRSSKHVVFLAGQEHRRRVGFLISARTMVYLRMMKHSVIPRR